jgi:PhnB protein
MKAANPYLNFNGNTEEAFNFYRSVFGGEFLGVVRFRDFGGDGMGVPEADLDKIAHIALPLGENNLLMATDTLPSLGQTLNVGTNSYIYLEVDTEEEAERIFTGLSEGGSSEMPLQKTEWAEKYGVCADRFGVQWMVGYTGDVEFKLGG